MVKLMIYLLFPHAMILFHSSFIHLPKYVSKLTDVNARILNGMSCEEHDAKIDRQFMRQCKWCISIGCIENCKSLEATHAAYFV